MPGHAALQASIDPLFERGDIPLASAILRELPPDADQGHCIGLSAGPQMAILASEVVAADALVRVLDRWTDLIRRVCHQRMAIPDELGEWIVSERSKVGGRPLGEVENDGVARREIAGFDQSGGQ